MKITTLALALMLASGVAMAQDTAARSTEETGEAQSVRPVFVVDPLTNEKRELSFADAKNPEVLVSLLPRLEGVPEIFSLYLEKGYAPFHAYILTNADVIRALKTVSPELPLNENVERKIEEIRNLYQPQ